MAGEQHRYIDEKAYRCEANDKDKVLYCKLAAETTIKGTPKPRTRRKTKWADEFDSNLYMGHLARAFRKGEMLEDVYKELEMDTG